MSATFMKRTPLALAMLALPSLVLAQGAGAGPTLPPVVVSGDTDSATPLLSPSATRLRQQLERTPGGVNLVAPQEKVRLNTLQDAIGGEPGIVVQEFFGGQDQPRLNIRGSGIQSNPVNRGVLLLQDGLPLNEADGSFVISTLEPRNSALVSVRRGANAQSAAASTLGGELDFQSVVGGQANHVRLDAGSFGRKGLTAGIGGQGEYWDGRIFVSHDEADGYRHHSASERSSLHANAGWRSSGIENRTYLSYTDLGFDIPNVIPKARLQSDPRSVLGDYNTPVDQANNIYLRDPNRQTRQLRLANRTAWGGEALSHTVGFYWQSIDDTFTSPAMSSPTDGHTTGLQWTTRGQSGALAYRAGLDWARTSMQRDMHPINAAGQRLPAVARYDLGAENRSANIALAWRLAPRLEATGDLRYVQSIRDARELGSGRQLDQQWNAALPKVGVLWQASDATRVFANLSRSSEAPTYWEILSGATMNRLDLQRAWTAEVGARGSYGTGRDAGEWSASVYRSHVRDELMEVFSDDGTTSGTFNYRDRTVHQGVELGAKGQVGWGGTTLQYQAAYTFNDFRFRAGEYAGNRIAGIPRHLLHAELMVRQGPWSMGPTLRWKPGKTPTNHANTAGTEQDSYALLGLRVAYQPGSQWQAYVSVDNLTDRTYASAFVIRGTGTAAMPTFLSGNGRSISAGLTYRF